ncbi:MAG: DUF262 domain-containing protein [Capnocytophaga sp.]|nr:DUF262 domain-containing protein [Capnocytophaga sp.]
MEVKKATIQDLFDMTCRNFAISDQHRAYCWEKEQISAFFNDLLVQSKEESDYFYGTIVLQEIEPIKKIRNNRR